MHGQVSQFITMHCAWLCSPCIQEVSHDRSRWYLPVIFSLLVYIRTTSDYQPHCYSYSYSYSCGPGHVKEHERVCARFMPHIRIHIQGPVRIIRPETSPTARDPVSQHACPGLSSGVDRHTPDLDPRPSHWPASSSPLHACATQNRRRSSTSITLCAVAKGAHEGHAYCAEA